MVYKIKIAVSACLLGQRVRYDGKEKKHSLLADFFLKQCSDKVEIVPFCPEVAIGLSVPRPKIQVVKDNLTTAREQIREQIRVLGVENHRQDFTQPLRSYAEKFLKQYPELKGLIVKSKSPSCGFNSTPLFEQVVDEFASEQGTHSYRQIEFTSGLFVQSLLALKPALRIIEEAQLNTESDCLNFLNELSKQ